eukprot:5425838-Pyramimonas_sp.AAC.1
MHATRRTKYVQMPTISTTEPVLHTLEQLDGILAGNGKKTKRKLKCRFRFTPFALTSFGLRTCAGLAWACPKSFAPAVH